MRFIETPIFTREIGAFLSHEEYRSLQLALLFRPEQGAVIPGSGGLRKLRWGFRGKGKRGGCRIFIRLRRRPRTLPVDECVTCASTVDVLKLVASADFATGG